MELVDAINKLTVAVEGTGLGICGCLFALVVLDVIRIIVDAVERGSNG